MPTSNDDFLQRLRATFKIEAEEHLQAISSMLLDLEKSPGSNPPQAAIENVYREAHSLKGAARSVDFSEIEAVCQMIEGVFAAWKRDLCAPSSEVLDSLHQALDTIHAQLAGPNSQSAGPPQFSAPAEQTPPKPVPPAAAPRNVTAATTAVMPAPAATAIAIEPDKSPAAQTVRISIDKLDSQLLQVEEMLVVKSMAADRAAEMRDLSARFDQWRKRWARVSSGALALRQTLERKGDLENQDGAPALSSALAEFLDWNSDYLRSMESRLLSLSVQAERDRHAVSKHVDDLLDESKKLRMLPFSTVSGIFPKLIRDLCRDQNKEADITIHGNEIEIDKRILEEMKDALIHVLRNCVDHGVELPVERVARGKPARAAIQMTVAPVDGNKVEIMVTDDGAGVDVESVKHSAVRLGIISPAEARSMNERDALALVFHSEVSATQTVTAISGRGLGMAIVRAKTEKLGGRVTIESKRYAGTTLRILLPLKLATFRGVVVSAAGCVCVLPTQNVERVLRVKPADIQTIENRESISLGGRVVSLVRLEAVLDLPPGARRPDDAAPIPVVVVHSADQRIAFAVDEVLREEEVLVKPLRRPLARVRNIAGATALESGKPVPILNASDLIKSAKSRGGAAPAPSAPAKPAEAQKRILVVEDSITSRMLVKGILESAGYQVEIAVDGIDAFTILREHPFDLVVSDVEMPRMDGVDLAGRIRADKRLCDLPIVLVTALESRQERERGIDAGASAYIVKSSFDQSNLLEAVRRLV
jgi:two-component system, chemotaxis family, sensor kinase CheA